METRLAGTMSGALGRLEDDEKICRPPREWRLATPLIPAKFGPGLGGLCSPIHQTTVPLDFEGQLIGAFLQARKAPQGPAAHDEHGNRGLFSLEMRGRSFLRPSVHCF